jgi:rubredoxin
MAKFRCSVCDPSCTLEIRGYNDLPTGCTCPEASGNKPVWKVAQTKTGKKSGKKAKSTKKTVYHTPPAPQKVSHENDLKRLLGF